jgi:hypothetical protein
MATNPQTAALNPAALIAARQNRTAFVPEVGGYLIVTMPGESMRCPVRRVFDEDTVIVEIDRPPISPMHNFRFEDHVGVRRKFNKQGREIWEAQRDREFLEEQKRITEMARPRAPVPTPPPPGKLVAKPPAKAAPKPEPKAKIAAKPHVKAAPVKAKAPVKAPVKAKAPEKAPVKAKTKAKTPVKRKAARR